LDICDPSTQGAALRLGKPVAFQFPVDDGHRLGNPERALARHKTVYK